jgi:hypothetical protein
MKRFKEYLGEAFFKVTIPDVAPTFVEAGSESAVKANMRKILKPAVIDELEIERVTPSSMKKMYRDMAKGDGIEENLSIPKPFKGVDWAKYDDPYGDAKKFDTVLSWEKVKKEREKLEKSKPKKKQKK